MSSSLLKLWSKASLHSQSIRNSSCLHKNYGTTCYAYRLLFCPPSPSLYSGPPLPRLPVLETGECFWKVPRTSIIPARTLLTLKSTQQEQRKTNLHSSIPEVVLKQPQNPKSGGPGVEKLVLYRAKWIRPFRLLVRFKVIQLGGIMALTIPLAEYSQQGSLSLGTTLAVSAVVGGAGAASAVLWYYSRRLIGEMSLLLPDLRIMQISVLDFWGNRENLHYDVRNIVPPLKGMTREDLNRAAQQIVIPLDVIGARQFVLSLRHGHLVHKDILFSLLNGSIERRDLENSETST